MKKIKLYQVAPEAMALFFTLLTLIMASIYDLSFLGPNAKLSLAKILFPNHFYQGLFSGLYVLLVVSFFGKKEKTGFVVFLSNAFYATRLFAVLVLAIYLDLNLKWWAHVLHTGNYDAVLQYTDQNIFSWLISICNYIAAALPKVGKDGDLYADLFLVMFCSSSIIGSFYGRKGLGLVICTISMVLFVGGFLYCLLPAYGPFIFGISPQNHYHVVQGMMFDTTQIFKTTHDHNLIAERFDFVLGAMPSLHVAHALAVFQAIYLLNRKFSWIFLGIALYLAVYAVVSQFHYVLDIVVGVLLARSLYPLQKYFYSQHGQNLVASQPV